MLFPKQVPFALAKKDLPNFQKQDASYKDYYDPSLRLINA
jgi:hypothetical protein